VAVASAPPDAWGYKAPAGIGASSYTEDKVPVEPLAVASLACSIAGPFTGVSALVGVVLGFVARARITRSEVPRRGLGAAVAGVIIGMSEIVVALVVVVGVLLAQPSPDVALARRELLPLDAEFPSWQAQGSDSEITQANFFGGYSGADLATVAHCVGTTPAGTVSDPAEAASQAFSPSGGSLMVSDTVDVFPTHAEAGKDAGAAAVPGSIHCQTWFTPSGMGPNYGPGEKDDPPVLLHRDLPQFGHLVADSECSVRYSYGGSSGIFYTDWVTVLVGRSESNLNLTNDGSPVPAQVIDRLVRDAIRQMQSAAS